MSTAVFPSSPIAAWPVVRTDSWDTIKNRSISGKMTVTTKRSQPIYSWELKFNVLRLFSPFTEFPDLLGFFDARNGGADSWLYSDADDNTASAQAFGTGDGTTALFQLTRSYGGFSIPVLAPNSITDVKVNGVTQTLGTGASNYNVTLWGGTYLSGGAASSDPPGSVRFGASIIPAAAAALSWDGTYYFPVRFMEDKCSFEKFAFGRYAVKKLTWEQVI